MYLHPRIFLHCYSYMYSHPRSSTRWYFHTDLHPWICEFWHKIHVYSTIPTPIIHRLHTREGGGLYLIGCRSSVNCSIIIINLILLKLVCDRRIFPLSQHHLILQRKQVPFSIKEIGKSLFTNSWTWEQQKWHKTKTQRKAEREKSEYKEISTVSMKKQSPNSLTLDQTILTPPWVATLQSIGWIT